MKVKWSKSPERNTMPFGVRIIIELIITKTCYYVLNYSNYATILGNSDVVFSNVIVKMKRLRKKSHQWLTNKRCFFKLSLFKFTQTHKPERKIPCTLRLILSKEPKLSMLTVCCMYVELITTIEVTVFCTMQTPHECGEI